MGKFSNIRTTIGRYKYAITLIGFALIICFIDGNNLMKRIQHKQEIRELKQEIEHYSKILTESSEGLKELTDSNKSVERIARTKYGMHLPDEEVFIIEE